MGGAKVSKSNTNKTMNENEVSQQAPASFSSKDSTMLSTSQITSTSTSMMMATKDIINEPIEI